MSLGECNSFRTLSLTFLVGDEGPLFKYPSALWLWDVAYSLSASPQERRAEHVLRKEFGEAKIRIYSQGANRREKCFLSSTE